MPSACTKPDTKASNEASNQIEKCVVVVEKKVRNLEKRKGKLDSYRAKQRGGETLNDDQQDAISKYDTVIQNLEFARDLQKQFQLMSAELEKLAKKRLKREKVERQEQEAARYREILQLQDLLTNMGVDDVREDFKTGSNGAILVTTENLDQLDEVYKLITPTRDGDSSYAEQLIQASEHLVCFLDGREKEVAGTTYKELKELADKINSCGYFENMANREVAAAPAETSTAETTEPEEPAATKFEEEPVENIEPPKSLPETQPMPSMEAAAPVLEQEERSAPVMPAPVINGPPILPEPEVQYEDNSFFTTAQFQARPRGFQEIVSSVQGNFNFIQDSELDVESPHRIDPAVVAARPMAKGISRSHVSDAVLMPGGYQGSSLLSSDDQTASAASTFSQQMAVQQQSVTDVTSHHAAAQPVSQSQHVTSDSLDFGAAATPSLGDSLQSSSSQLQFGAVDSMVHESQTQPSQQQSQSAYGQSLMSQSLGGSAASQHYSDQSSSSMRSSHMGGLQEPSVDSLGSASSSAVPQPIPLPSETIPGQSLMSGAYNKSDSAASSQQEKKAYRMNPNADPFKSTAMFSSSSDMSSGLQSTSSTTQSGGATGLVEDTPKTAWNTITQQRPPQQQQQQHQHQQHHDDQDTQGDYSNYNPSSQFSSRGGAQRGGRGGYGGGRGGGGGGGNRGSNNGFSRGGSRGGGQSMYSGNRGDGSNRGFSNGRGGGGGGSRGGSAWQGYPPRNDYRPEGGYQGYANNYSSSGSNGMRGGGPQRGGAPGGNRGGGRGGSSFGRPNNLSYSQ